MTTNLQQYNTFTERAEDAPRQATYQPAREIEGATRVTTLDGVQTREVLDNEKARSSEAGAFHGTEGIFATAVHPRGLPVMAIEDDTLLTLPDGVQAQAKTLAMMGAITRNKDGSYSENTRAAPEAAPESTDEEIHPMHPTDLGMIQATLANVDPGAIDGMVAVAVGFAAGKMEEAQMMAKWSQATGQEPGEGYQDARASLQHQADTVITKRFGLTTEDLDGFYSFCREQHRDELAHAVRQQMTTANMAGYKALAQRYMTSVPPSVEALQKAGLKVRAAQQGGYEVNVPGKGWTSPMAAAKAGWL